LTNAGWLHGITTKGLSTGLRKEKIRSDFEIPDELSPTIIVGFGYLAMELTGKRKDRIPLE